MLLTDEEIHEFAYVSKEHIGFARAIEAAILAKLASAEFPEPDVSVVDGEDLYGYATFTVAHSTKQLTAWGNTRYAQGAAAQLSADPVATALADITNTGYIHVGHAAPIKFGTKLYTRRQA